METCTSRRFQFILSIGLEQTLIAKFVRLKAASLGFHKAVRMFERVFGFHGVKSKVYIHTERRKIVYGLKMIPAGIPGALL